DPGQGFNFHRKRHALRWAERLLGAGATELRSESVAVGQCFQWRISVAGWASGGPGPSRRSVDGHAAGNRYAASGGGWSFRPGSGDDAHLHGEESGPVGFDHNPGRSTRSGDAADCHERGAGGDYDSVGIIYVWRQGPVAAGQRPATTRTVEISMTQMAHKR